MCKTQDLLQEIALTEASLEQNRALANRELSSPECYALPLAAFVVGLVCHKSLPDPIQLLGIAATQLKGRQF
jgi:hypothetical protein